MFPQMLKIFNFAASDLGEERCNTFHGHLIHQKSLSFSPTHDSCVQKGAPPAPPYLQHRLELPEEGGAHGPAPHPPPPLARDLLWDGTAGDPVPGLCPACPLRGRAASVLPPWLSAQLQETWVGPACPAHFWPVGGALLDAQT